MAKTRIYNDDILIEAVEKYSEQHTSGKIKATKLAEWAQQNIIGLENVRDYHFLREITYKDPKSGQKKSKKRPCTVRMEEINSTRNVSAAMEGNVLLKAPNVDSFFQLPTSNKRKCIMATREQVENLVARNIYLERENKLINAENKRLYKLLSEMDQKLANVMTIKYVLNKKLNQYIAVTNEEQRRAALEKIGLSEGEISLRKNVESLSVDIEDVFSISKAIKSTKEKQHKGNNDVNMAEMLMEDIQF